MNRRLIAVAAAAAVVLVAIWTVMLWSPQSKSLAKARADTAKAVLQENVLSSKVGALQQERTLLPGLNAQLAALNVAIPTVPGVPQIIDTMTATAAASGVALLSISPGSAPSSAAAAATATPAATASVMTVGMSVSGTYAQLIDFVNRLSAMPRLTVVQGLGFAAPDASGRSTIPVVVHLFTAPAS